MEMCSSPFALTLLTLHLQLRRYIKIHTSKLSSLRIIRTVHISAQLAAIIKCTFLQETASPLSRCSTSHFKSVKYLKYFKIILKISLIILFYVRVAGGGHYATSRKVTGSRPG
jgi:hypothetical protein